MSIGMEQRVIGRRARSAALAAAGLLSAGVAWGQSPMLTQVSSGPTLVAAERFGGEPRSIAASSFDLNGPAEGGRPYVGLNVDAAAVGAGNVAEITFTLAGATFDQPVGSGDLDQRLSDHCAGAQGDALETSVVSGGARGGSTVTFRVAVTESGGAGLAVDQSICFWVPDLMASLTTVAEPEGEPPVRGVVVTAGIRRLDAVGGGFPSEIDATGVHAETLFEAAPVLVADLGMGGTAHIDIADRTRIVLGGEPDPSRRTERAGLRLGALTVDLSEQAKAGSIWTLDGSRNLDRTAVDSSLSGEVVLTAAGPFRSGDKVIVGTGRDALEGAPSGGLATVAVRLGVVDGLPVVYLPGGTEALRPSTFALGAAYAFNDRLNHDSVIPSMSHGELQIAGVNVEGYAYGLFRGGGADASFLRVTCEAAADCGVFLDCRSANGQEHFGSAPVVPAGATAVWTGDAIAGLLGGGWTSGLGRCEILSTGGLSVQHMVRSGGVLNNHSMVVGRHLDDGAIAAIKALVDDICKSVGHADPDNDPATDDRTPCVPMERAP